MAAVLGLFPSAADGQVLMAKGSFAKITTTGSQSVTGVGFQPKAVLFFWTRQTAEGYAASISSGYGFATGSGAGNQAAIAVASDDNVTTTNAGSRYSASNSIILLSSGTPALGSQASFTSMDADGFTVNWGTSEARADVIHYVALGGSGMTNAKVGSFNLNTVTGAQSVTGVGFTPDLLMFLAPARTTTAADANATHGSLNFGAATATAQGSVGFGITDAIAVSGGTYAGHVMSQTEALRLMRRSATDGIASVTAMGADGFSLNVTTAPGGTQPVYYLALKGGGYKVGFLAQPTAVGNQAITGAGMQARGVILASHNDTQLTTVRSNAAPAAKISIGAATSTARGAIWAQERDDTNTTSDANMSTVTTAALRLATYGNVTNAEAGLASLDADGFTLNWTAADSTQRQVMYVVAGDPPTVTLANASAGEAATTLAPGDPAVALDAFTLATNTGTVTPSSITVTMPAGSAALIGALTLENASACNQTTPYATISNPASDAPSFTAFTGLTLGTTPSNLWVCVTPKTHAAMAAPPGTQVAVTGQITAVAATGYAVTGTDTVSPARTIDNLSPTPAISGLGGTPDYGAVVVGWTAEPTDADYTTGGEVVVLRKAGSAPTEVPVEGTNYAGGETIGTATVACVAAPGVGQCTANGLSSASNYYFVAFARDVRFNYSVASGSAGPYTPLAIAPVTVGAVTAVANGATQVTVTAPFTGDVGAPNSSTAVERSASSSGPWSGVAGCGALTGPTPRTCVDTTVVATTTYYYRVTFTDPDGVLGINPQIVSVTTPRNSYVLTVSGTAATATTPAPGTSGVVVGRIALQTTTGVGPVRVTALRIQNTGTAIAGDDVAAVQVYADNGTLGTLDGADVLLGTTLWDGSRYVLQGLSDDVSTGGQNLLVTLAVSTGATNARTFRTSLAAADVVVVAPDTVAGSYASATGATITATGVVQEGDPTTNSTKPLVTILNPSNGGTVTGSFRLQLKVWDPNGIAAVTNIQVSNDNGATWSWMTISPSAQKSPYTAAYDSDTTNAAIYDVSAAGLTPGTYSIKAHASDDGGATWVASGTVVIKAIAAPGGDGSLLVRDNSSQLCTDCHAGLKTHSSQSTSRSHGQWATNCRDCHTPHSTTNIALVRTQITPPQVTTVSQPTKAVKFSTRVGDSGSSAVETASFTNSDNSGPCQVCHTRTQNPATLVARWQNSGNADTHFDATSGTAACTGCHPHKQGFKGVESSGGAVDPVSFGKCSSCHAGTFGVMSAVSGSRHAIGSVVGTNDYYVDSGVTWGSPLASVTAAQRSCVNMCHQDHVHNPVGGTSHSNNGHGDATNTGARAVTRDAGGNITGGTPAATDFNAAATNGGLCISCHRNPVESGATPARPAIAKAAYDVSAHDFTSTAAPAYTWQFTMHDGSQFARNCTKCHASRTEGTTPTKGGGITAVHGTSDPFLLSGSKNPAGTAAGFVCYNCHGNTASPASGAQGNRSNKNIQDQIAKTSNHPSNADAVHDSVAEYNNASFGAFNAVARHASCMDCHDSHEARAGAHAVTTNLAGPPLEGAWGAQLSTNAAFWTAPASGNFTKKVIVAGTDVEATLCFKCHSAYYGTLPTSPSGGYTETDQAKEFNPGNVGNFAGAWAAGETAGGFHPVLAGCGNNLGAINMANLVTTNFAWRTTGARNLMTCTDCHESDTTADPNGPHGSTAGFILKGPNTGWAATTTTTAAGMPAGTFCSNCHSSTYANSRYMTGTLTDGHVKSNHLVACWNCHARIPHGGPRPGILVASAGVGANVPAVIADWDQSAPYFGLTSASSGKLYIVSYPANNTTQWNQSDCGCNGSGH